MQIVKNDQLPHLINEHVEDEDDQNDRLVYPKYHVGADDFKVIQLALVLIG